MNHNIRIKNSITKMVSFLLKNLVTVFTIIINQYCYPFSISFLHSYHYYYLFSFISFIKIMNYSSIFFYILKNYPIFIFSSLLCIHFFLFILFFILFSQLITMMYPKILFHQMNYCYSLNLSYLALELTLVVQHIFVLEVILVLSL